MHEHGALDRILLIYEEALRRLRSRQSFDPAPLARSGKIMRDFIEGHHERLEEDYVFPRLQQAGRLPRVVDTLLKQHRAGRRLTETVIDLSTPTHLKDRRAVSVLQTAMTQFIYMYRPHAAREDTEIFPAFREVVTPQAYQVLGEQFEKMEEERFGSFEKILAQIIEIEKAFGLNDLAKFTPA